MKVLFVQGAAERAGAERVLLTLLGHLDRTQVHPIVAFCARGPFVGEVADAGVEVLELREVPRLRQPWRAPTAIRELAATIREVEPDVVQATGEKMAVYAGWAARLAGRPCVFWLHDSPGTSPGARLTQLAMAATPREAVVSCADWLARAFRPYGLRVHAIQNGIDLSTLRAPPGARPILLEEAGWPEDAAVVGHFARLEPWKGTDVFLRAAARVARQVPEARFLVVGGSLYGRGEPYATSLPGLAEELGLAERVHFTGYRTDALDLMAGCDVVVHASRRPDPFPTVVLEGMALGLPVLATRTKGPEEQIVDGVDGLLVPPHDVSGMAGAIEALCRSPDLRSRLGRAARGAVVERFDARTMAGRFEDLYRSLDEAGRRRSSRRRPEVVDG